MKILFLFVLSCVIVAQVAEAQAKEKEPPVNALVLGPADGDKALELTVADVKGSYTIPYIQSGADLAFSIAFGDYTDADAVLKNGQGAVAQQKARSDNSKLQFNGLPPGEYSLDVTFGSGDGKSAKCHYAKIAVGNVLAAIGDSITEGYYGRGFMQDDLHLRADMFPSNAASRDGRNFPQYAPTTAQHMPSVNCFESWMTRLNDLLAEKWRQPVFIANEGWGGIASGEYLEKMRHDANWQQRMRALEPNAWMIHLGANDGRAAVATEKFIANIEAIVDLLEKDYGARPRSIFIARICYDYFEGAEPILRGYCSAIDALVDRRGLGRGPDFFAAYSTDRKRWYGEDVIHPNMEGMRRMADLWADALAAQWPQGLREPRGPEP